MGFQSFTKNTSGCGGYELHEGSFLGHPKKGTKEKMQKKENFDLRKWCIST
jgi:hypothetical protein